MELRPTMRAGLRQGVIISPRVIQSMKVLKFGHEELFAYLKEQEERNPLIEVVLPEPAAGPDAVARGAGGTATKPAADRSAPASSRLPGGRGASAGGDLRSIEERVSSPVSLRQHLLQQVALNIPAGADRRIAVELVESIEPDGYLRRDPDEIADALGTAPERVEAVLKQVQCFEPAGIGARSLAECLRLQIEEKGALTPEVDRLLDHLDLLGKYDLDGLARACGVDQKAVATMIRDIRSLDPRPGRRFESEPVLPAMPDVVVEVRPNGVCHVELNPALLPRLLVNREYYAEMRGVAAGADDVRFVADCLKDATWLTRNLEERATTLLRVATEIVKRQKAFFVDGAKEIRPLCQGDVAQALGIHRSTVCRAISGKCLMTSRGLFELRYFFSNALASADGQEDVSAQSIRARIGDLIASETAGNVLSDDAIMAALRREGVEIARRTVAKYREMMRIPPSSTRRRQRRAAQIEAQAAMPAPPHGMKIAGPAAPPSAKGRRNHGEYA